MEKSTLSIKETLSITFRTLKILFHAAPGGIAFLGILSTIAGVCPFLTLILSRAFLDSLARACGQQAFEMKIIWLLFFLFLTNMMLSVVNNLSILLKSDVSGRISLLVNAQVLEKCVHLPMSQYDNETTYNRIRFTSEQTSIRCTNLINTFFSIVQCLISFASVVCVLVSFNGIIVIASVVASIPLFFVNKYVSSFWYKISVGRVEKQRYSDVLRDLMLRNDNIKELKLFGSLSYLKSRILNQQTDFFREDQMNRKKFCKIDTAQKAANDFVILLLKLWIIILGIKQRATLGTINLYTSSLDQIQSAIFSFCTQLNTFYEQALYLESLFDLFDMQTEDENCGTPLTEPIRTIEFRHVYFSYPATNVYALKNVSFVLDDRHTKELQIIDRETFDKANDIINRRKAKSEQERKIAHTSQNPTLLAGIVYCAHCGAKMSGFMHTDRYKLADGSIREKVQPKYNCFQRGQRNKGGRDCDGQALYLAERVDAIVLKIVEEVFEQIRDTPYSQVAENRIRQESNLQKTKRAAAEKKIKAAQHALERFEGEILKCLDGTSNFTEDMIAKQIRRYQQELDDAKAEYAELQNARLNEAAEIRKLRTYYDDFKGWAEEFDTAPLEMKRMILSHLIDRVEVGRKYQVIVKFNMKYRQFLECTAETYNTEIGA